MPILSKNEAVTYLGLDPKVFENYFKHAEEFPCLERVGKERFKFDQETLRAWKEDCAWRTCELDFEDYKLCFDFLLAMHFRGYVASDWGTGRSREFGQKLTNWMKGQLAEIAVKKFLYREFGVTVELDFGIREKIVPQDIIGVRENRVLRDPKVKVAIKSSKPKSCFLVLGGSEIDIPDRKSDIYIFCRPEIADDHILGPMRNVVIQMVQNQPHYDLYKDKIPNFENIACEIAGFCQPDELEKVTSIPGQEFENGYRYVKATGKLHRSRSEWEDLARRL